LRHFVGGLAFTEALSNSPLDSLHLGIEVVEEAEGKRFGNHGQLGEPNSSLP